MIAQTVRAAKTTTPVVRGDMDTLRHRIEALFELSRDELLAEPDGREVFARFLELVEAGELRAAHRGEDGVWRADAAVKKGILLGFRLGTNTVYSDGPLPMADKDTFPPRTPPFVERNIRIVPGGSAIRSGAYVGQSVTCMPPMYINVGAYVDDGTMVDSHALVGSCAQIGKRVHLSAGVQIGGVLEPIGLAPVVVEDDVMVGGNCGIYEGTVVRSRSVVGTGVILNASTKVYDLVRKTTYSASVAGPLVIPEGAVVVPGSRPARGEFASEHGLHIATPLIIKYRDASTDARTALEEALR
jgi:2,3,4,5-tetrahydropyridine-2-carboxylate N-succinyltransferase